MNKTLDELLKECEGKVKQTAIHNDLIASWYTEDVTRLAAQCRKMKEALEIVKGTSHLDPLRLTVLKDWACRGLALDDEKEMVGGGAKEMMGNEIPQKKGKTGTCPRCNGWGIAPPNLVAGPCSMCGGTGSK